MITNEQIKKCINSANEKGFTIKVRDISFVLLAKQFEDTSVAYKCIFGNDADFNADYLNAYMETNAMVYLTTYIEQVLSKEKKSKNYLDITFEENKEALLLKLQEIEEAKLDGRLDYKDAIKYEVDIRTKLNDKFNVADDSKEQTIIVNNKFSDICSYCGHETPMPSKERCMKVYNLIEKES